MPGHTQLYKISEESRVRASFFSLLPTDLIFYAVDKVVYNSDPNSEIAQLLHHIAHGNPDEVEKKLKANPQLLLQASDARDPAGNLIQRVTPYECALGAGDEDIVAKIAAFFPMLPQGEAERTGQTKHYEHSIMTMLSQAPGYDFASLVEIIKKSSAEDVRAALSLDFTHPSPLLHALEAFRIYFSPRVIAGGMHFNYANLLKAYEIFVTEFVKLYKASGNNYNKCDLFWRQVIGYLQRGLPACDRQAFAQGIEYIIEQLEPNQRSFKLRGETDGSFPLTQGGEFLGLGFEQAFSCWGYMCEGADGMEWDKAVVKCFADCYQKLCQAKASKLQQIIQPSPEQSKGSISVNSLK